MGTVRLRMTLWNVAVLALILGALGGVVRYKVQADLFATVDRTLAERAHEAGRLYTLGPPYAGRNARTTVRSRLLDPMAVAAEGSLVGSKPRALPPLQPRVIPRDPAGGPGGVHWEEPWDRHAYVRSLAGRTVYSTVRDGRLAGAGAVDADRAPGQGRCACFSSPIRSMAFCGRSTR